MNRVQTDSTDINPKAGLLNVTEIDIQADVNFIEPRHNSFEQDRAGTQLIRVILSEDRGEMIRKKLRWNERKMLVQLVKEG